MNMMAKDAIDTKAALRALPPLSKGYLRVGAFVGGSLYSLIATGSIQLAATSLSIPGLVISVLGAIVAIYLWGLMARNA